MKINNLEYSRKQMSKIKLCSLNRNLKFKEGVTISIQGKYLARVKSRGRIVTIFQSKDKKQVQKIYNDYYKKLKL